jgi:hypothetical protein
MPPRVKNVSLWMHSRAGAMLRTAASVAARHTRAARDVVIARGHQCVHSANALSAE